MLMRSRFPRTFNFQPQMNTDWRESEGLCPDCNIYLSVFICVINSFSKPLDRLPGTAGAQDFHLAASGDAQTGRNLGQRIQHEGALVQPGVRQGKSRFVADQITIQQQVEIQGAWSS